VHLFFFLGFSSSTRAGLDEFYEQRVTVNTVGSDPPTPQARAAAHAAQRREQERVARAKEKKFRRREHLEQYNEEYRLREQWGLSPLLVPGNSSSEEEESDGGQAASNRWNPPPPSRRVEEVAVELVPMAGAEALATGSLVEAPTCATEVPPSLRGRGSRVSPT
jgi:hypothetical protein